MAKTTKKPTLTQRVAALEEGRRRRVERGDAARASQLERDVATLARFLAKLPGVESSLADDHAAVREIAARRS